MILENVPLGAAFDARITLFNPHAGTFNITICVDDPIYPENNRTFFWWIARPNDLLHALIQNGNVAPLLYTQELEDAILVHGLRSVIMEAIGLPEAAQL